MSYIQKILNFFRNMLVNYSLKYHFDFIFSESLFFRKKPYLCMAGYIITKMHTTLILIFPK